MAAPLGRGPGGENLLGRNDPSHAGPQRRGRANPRSDPHLRIHRHGHRQLPHRLLPWPKRRRFPARGTGQRRARTLMTIRADGDGVRFAARRSRSEPRTVGSPHAPCPRQRAPHDQTRLQCLDPFGTVRGGGACSTSRCNIGASKAAGRRGPLSCAAVSLKTSTSSGPLRASVHTRKRAATGDASPRSRSVAMRRPMGT